jgi:pimeloyl-ACP methyl ester carboxylesterase
LRNKRVAALSRACWLALALALAVAACKVEVGLGDQAWRGAVANYRHDADVGGYKLHYIDVGQGEPVVLIHGFADSTYTFSKNIAPLVAAGRRVILVDQPGLGRSELPPEPYVYSLENQSEQILKLLDQLGLQRFAVGGSSMGGGVSLYLAWKHPDRVTRAALFDPACFRLDQYGWMPLVSHPSIARLATAIAIREGVAYGLYDVFFDTNKVTSAVIDEYAQALNKPGFQDVLWRLIHDYFSPEFERMTRSYGEIKTPMLLIWGDHDKWAPPLLGPRLRDAIPGSRLIVVPDCGHLPHFERPEVVNPFIVDFYTERYMPAGR